MNLHPRFGVEPGAQEVIVDVIITNTIVELGWTAESRREVDRAQPRPTLGASELGEREPRGFSQHGLPSHPPLAWAGGCLVPRARADLGYAGGKGGTGHAVSGGCGEQPGLFMHF